MTTQPSASQEGAVPTTPKTLRALYEAGATVDQLVTDSRLSYGTVLNRLRAAGTVMRTPWQTRRLRVDGQARRRLAARLRTLYDEHGATLTDLAAAGAGSRRAARRLLIEAGGAPRSTQQTLRIRTAADAPARKKLAASLRAEYEGGASVPELAKECNYSVATVYRLLHLAKTRMRPQHRHGPARRSGKRS
ncbi:DNA-directed RNA polymerase specialized sigma24 family protein [Streptomyces aurantiacus]|uniref:helix-turn-helix domain-containing protein n=1 Tax=Streptomyces aurantiacus TaxID=47760 RepID=UPI00278FDEDD|nr:helix-turn-helix domain-containing protein [Streptomyces aurantiacus]MDQ0772713.1 DNA-directed RNA polymerase specialized sigma24 family protein [Streptomyces aurantiacus]